MPQTLKKKKKNNIKMKVNILFFLLLSLFGSLTDMMDPAECLSSPFKSFSLLVDHYSCRVLTGNL